MLRRLVLILLWTLLVIGAALADALWLWHPKIEGGIEAHLVGALREAAADKRLGSASLVLMERGRIVAEHGFGMAPVQTDRTLFQLASVSKAVTAWGVMKLVEEGKLALDEPVVHRLRRWRFPGSGALGEKVTVRHLLSHTAGLDDGLGYGGFPLNERPQTLEQSLLDAKDSTVGRPRPVIVVREPGTALSYSGGGYTVLQLLIEEVTGRRFADYMRDAVLQPLGMRTATFDIDEILAGGRARDLATPFDHEVKPRPHRRHTAQAAVSLHATPRDLGQFLRAFTGENRVLRRETLNQMLMPQPGTSGTWGLGHTIFATNIVGHDGGSPPAWGAMLRVNRATGNGMALTVSGGRGAINQLGHDWVYWETGVVTPMARRQRLYGWALPASIAIVAGAVVIATIRFSR